MICISYTAEERETIIRQDDASKLWTVYTLQSTMITKLTKAGAKPYRVDPDGAHWYEGLKSNQVSFRSGKERVVSEKQKQAASERFKRMHEDKKKEESNG